MKQLLVLIVIAITIRLVHLVTVVKVDPSPELLKRFQEWKEQYGKVYRTKTEEDVRRIIFTRNVKVIDDHNSDPTNSFKMAANSYADMTPGEFSKLLGSRDVSEKISMTINEEEGAENVIGGGMGDSTDYEKDPCIGPVEHQQSCGSCYAFSAAHVAAWHYCRKNGGKYINLSKQQIVDCSYRDNGCMSGWTATASNYMAKHGVLAEEDYPYVSAKNRCNGLKLRTGKLHYPISGTMKIAKDEESMKKALAEHGPLLVIIDALKLAFYKSGLITGDACEHGTVNHAVVVVAFKPDNNKGYWRVKNHWGTDWGEGGYFNLEAFSPVKQGCLGIAGYPSHAY